MTKKQPARPPRRTTHFLAASLALLLAGAVFGMSFAVRDRILPGVSIGSVDVGGLRPAQAEQLVSAALVDARLTLTYASHNWRPKLSDLGVRVDVRTAVNRALRIGRRPETILNGLSVGLPVVADERQLEPTLTEISREVLALPVNAKLSVVNGELTVTEGVAGEIFDLDDLMAALDRVDPTRPSAVSLRVTTAEPTVKASDLTSVIAQASLLAQRDYQVMIDRTAAVISKNDLLTWFRALVTADSKLTASIAAVDATLPTPRLDLDDEQLASFLKQQAASLEVAPEPQKVLQGEQRTEVFSEGKPGWRLDTTDAVAKVEAAILTGSTEPVRLSLTEIPRPIEYVDPPAAPIATGKVVSVDLTVQHAYIFQDSRLIYSMPISSGINDWTPTGTFHVYAKTKKQKMSGPGYYVPNVPNILWFKGDYSMHGVYWHKDFGIRPRSHGCVGQSVTDSEFTYNFAEVGMPIVIFKS